MKNYGVWANSRIGFERKNMGVGLNSRLRFKKKSWVWANSRLAEKKKKRIFASLSELLTRFTKNMGFGLIVDYDLKETIGQKLNSRLRFVGLS